MFYIVYSNYKYYKSSLYALQMIQQNLPTSRRPYGENNVEWFILPWSFWYKMTNMNGGELIYIWVRVKGS